MSSFDVELEDLAEDDIPEIVVEGLEFDPATVISTFSKPDVYQPLAKQGFTIGKLGLDIMAPGLSTVLGQPKPPPPTAPPPIALSSSPSPSPSTRKLRVPAKRSFFQRHKATIAAGVVAAGVTAFGFMLSKQTA